MSFSRVYLGVFGLGLLLGVVGCGKEAGDTGLGGGGTDGGTDGGTGGTGGAVAFSIEGTALDFAAQAPAAEGLCVYAADPTDSLGGGDLILLAETTVGAGGAFTLEGVSTESVLGLLLLVQDCAGEGTVMPSATGIALEDYEGLGDGDVLGGRSAYVVSADFQAGIDLSVSAATGGASDIGSDGALIGFVFDSSGTPVSGATVDCGGCADIFYADPNDADGLFTDTKTGVNTSTDAMTKALWVVPGAPITQYTCEDGVNSYEPLLVGSQPGVAVFVAFYAE